MLANLKIAAQAARFRGSAVGHVLLTGSPGLGKTSLAMALAHELGLPCHSISGPLLVDTDALHGALSSLSAGAILFIDEVHAVPRRVLEALYEAMESRPFTLVAATTDPDACPEAFRSRFVMREHLDPYTESDLAEIAARAAARMALTLDTDASAILAAASRGTPRRTISLLKRARDLAQSTSTNHIDQATVSRTLTQIGIDDAGLDPIERRAIEVLRSSRRPVSATRLARLANVTLNEWLHEHELHLLTLGLLEITPRGRVAL